MGRYSIPVDGLIAGLSYVAWSKQNPPRLLDGLKIIPAPRRETEGLKDLPCVRIVIPDFDEVFAPARNIDGTLKVKLTVSDERSKGIANALLTVEKVLDAIQTDPVTGICALPGTARHFDCKAEESVSYDNDITIPIIIFLKPFKSEVGKRQTPPAPAVS